MDPLQQRFEELGKLRALKRTSGKASEGTLVGTCMDMCPEYERVERQLHLDLTRPFEMEVAVKKYHRPAAGNDAPLPEDVRPPIVLLRTLDYLLSEAVLLRTDVPFVETQKFLRDRMRSLRQDLTLQGVKSLEAVHINQCIARFHIYCSVALRDVPKAEFDPFQNLEQLRKVLQTLYELYEDGHKHGRISRTPIVFREEAEFRAYRILAHLSDANEAFEDSAPPNVQMNEQFRNALHLANAFHTGNAYRFKRILEKETFLFQALSFQWHAMLQTRLSEIEERSFEKMVEPVLTVPTDMPPVFEGPLDTLMKIGCVDEGPTRLKREFKSLIYQQLLDQQVKPLFSHILDDCYAHKQKELNNKQEAERKVKKDEQDRMELEHNQRMQKLMHDMTEEIARDGAQLFLQQVAEDEIKRYQGNRFAETKYALAKVIYDSCLAVCVPFYTRQIFYEALAEKRDSFFTKKQTFQKMLRLVTFSEHCSLPHSMLHVDKEVVDDSLERRLLDRAGEISQSHPLFKQYKAACMQVINDQSLSEEEKIMEIEHRYPTFIFSSITTKTHIKPDSKHYSPHDIEALKRMVAAEQAHTQMIETRLSELIKSDF